MCGAITTYSEIYELVANRRLGNLQPFMITLHFHWHGVKFLMKEDPITVQIVLKRIEDDCWSRYRAFRTACSCTLLLIAVALYMLHKLDRIIKSNPALRTSLIRSR
jgi:hypothetical protein